MVVRTLEKKFRGFYYLSPGSVYPTLQLLEDFGYVSIKERDGKKVYSVTEEGRNILHDPQGCPEAWTWRDRGAGGEYGASRAAGAAPGEVQVFARLDVSVAEVMPFVGRRAPSSSRARRRTRVNISAKLYRPLTQLSVTMTAFVLVGFYTANEMGTTPPQGALGQADQATLVYSSTRSPPTRSEGAVVLQTLLTLASFR